MRLNNNVLDGLVLNELLFGNGHLCQGPPGIDVKNHGNRIFTGQKGGVAALVHQVEFLCQFGNPTGGIVQVTEEAGPSLADVDTGRFDPVVDAVLAKRTLGNSIFSFILTGEKLLVPVAGAVRAGIDALAAADTQIVVVQDQTVRTLIGGTAAIADGFAF